MREIRYSTPFRKDYKHLQKRGKDLAKLRTVIVRLAADETLEKRYKDHPLQGRYAGARDCHISPDWVLIYAISGNELRLIRTGSHADLFG